MDMSKYKGMFISEAKEHIHTMGQLIVALEEDPSNQENIQSLFRSAHSVKGMAASMGYNDVASLSHKMEDMMDIFRKGERAFGPESADLILEGIDALEQMVGEIENDAPSTVDVAAVIARVALIKNGGAEKETASAPEEVKEEAPPQPAPPVGKKTGVSNEKHFNISVEVAGTAQLPGMRGFLVYKRLGDLGTIISTEPDIESIKKGEFKKKLLFRITTEADSQAIKKLLSSIPELASVHLEEGTQNIGDENIIVKKSAPSPRTRQAKTVRVNTELLDNLINIVGEMIIARSSIFEASRDIDSVPLQEGHILMGNLIRNLHSQVISVRMTPIDNLMERLPRVVRDIARKNGKEVELKIEGRDIELDRVIVEEMADPLVHILRNSVDHGIELPEEREEAGKPRKGTVTIRGMRERDQVIINVSDDGRGMNAEKILNKAIEKGVLTADKGRTLTDREIFMLICHPGLSTAEKVTDISGRGVGMDAVKNVVEGIGGSIYIDSVEGKGSSITLKVPLSVAIIQVLLISAAGFLCAMPINKVLRTLEVERREIKRSQKKLGVMLDGELIPLLSLRKMLRLEKSENRENLVSIVLTEIKGRRVGIVVDSFAGQQEAFIKNLEPPLSWVKGLSGATILGDGSVIFLLDISNLF